MDLKDKRFFKAMLELIFHNPEEIKHILNVVYPQIDFSSNHALNELKPLIDYMHQSKYYGTITAIDIAQKTIKDEILRSLFEETILNNIILSYHESDNIRILENVTINRRGR